MKKLLSLLTLLCITLITRAQTYPLVRIRSIQEVSGSNLAMCRDTSLAYGDTVRVRGVVLMDGGLAQASGGRNVWIMDSTGAWSGIDVFGYSATATSPVDILDLVAGDSVELTGFIDEYQGETEIRPLQTGTTLQVLASGRPRSPLTVNLSQINDNAQNNLLTTGEKYEGTYVELQNVTVQSVSPFSGGTRVSFVVQDGSGNKINVSDRFLVARLPALGGTFVPPNVGDQYCYLRGVLLHSKNNCTGFSGRGYELHPFDSTCYSICSAAPSVFNVRRNLVTPTSAQPVIVSADITDADGISSAVLKYAVGIGNTTYTPVNMTFVSGNTWQGTIPAQANGSFVKYYVCATDTPGNTSCNPNVPGNNDPKFYTVRDNGTTIYDVQFVPTTFASNASGYVDMEVTVEGVVTGSVGDLGYVFIQQENQLDWAGIMLLGSNSLNTLTLGQKVRVTGTVKESFGYTRIENVTSVQSAGSGSIAALNLPPDLFTTWGFATNEAYEGMLVKIANPTGALHVVDKNADGPPSNFGEYRVGDDPFDPNTGTRILAGRQTNSTFSSLRVSFVNDSMWATTDGLMLEPPCVVDSSRTFDSIIGIVYYSFSNMKVLPRNNADFYGNLTWCLTGTASGPAATAFMVYPNPNFGQFEIRHDAGVNREWTLFDLNGRMVRSGVIGNNGGTTHVETGNIPAGAYLMKVSENGNPVYHQKLVIRK